MKNQWSAVRGTAILMIAAVLFLHGSIARGAEARRPLPKFDKVEQTVERYLASLPKYQPGDILTRSQVEAVLEQLRALGWTVADRETILKRTCSDDSYLIQQLQTPSGRAFMRDIKEYPNAYDRLDRLARLPYGHNTIEALVRGPDGYKMIEYMTTAPGGRSLGQMLSEAPLGKGFNKPTKRIYTAEQLLAALKISYGAAAKATESAASTR